MWLQECLLTYVVNIYIPCNCGLSFAWKKISLICNVVVWALLQPHVLCLNFWTCSYCCRCETGELVFPSPGKEFKLKGRKWSQCIWKEWHYFWFLSSSLSALYWLLKLFWDLPWASSPAPPVSPEPCPVVSSWIACRPIKILVNDEEWWLCHL